ncbi:MAG: F0F1 ATP synthase subunit A [Sporomusaceae bacterium]|jgi:F-type H+-transporting ATPase subunit a|nr:F0F1 ATP synthase subunit A [Sporomusaceae bacterium]
MDHGSGGHAIGQHQVEHYFGLAFNMDILYMTWITMAIVIVLAFVATRNLKMVPTGWQNFLEMIVVGLIEQVEENIGPKGKKLIPLIITLFLFILVSNELGMIPTLVSPTSDINTTLGLALLIVGLTHLLSIKEKGIVSYTKHFFQPAFPFVIVNLVEEIAKPITLSFRLFGNILAGEILLVILNQLVPYLVPTLWLTFSVFVGVIQALIFTMLSISYLSSAFSEGH